MTHENEAWIKVGLLMDEIKNNGLFPGMGYDKKGWEAWCFFKNPIEGYYPPADATKVFKATPLEAVEELFQELIKLGKLPQKEEIKLIATEYIQTGAVISINIKKQEASLAQSGRLGEIIAGVAFHDIEKGLEIYYHPNRNTRDIAVKIA